jgi:REP-associated tyrosine transposase
MMGYGHWLGNDPRGSGSAEIAEKFEELGPIHFGRKKQQPTRQELRDFYHKAEGLLDHPVIWFDDRMRIVIADAFSQVVKEFGYTAWACAVLQNHAHKVLRVHRDDGHFI